MDCFGTILKNEEYDMEGLASMVYHADDLLHFIDEVPGHPFLTIPILSRPDLLAELK